MTKIEVETVKINDNFVYVIKGTFHQDKFDYTNYTTYGKWHRDDGPARIYHTGAIEWWFNDRSYKFDEWCELAGKTDEEKAALILEFF